eukprot:286800-Rhodomonas_salina.2
MATRSYHGRREEGASSGRGSRGPRLPCRGCEADAPRPGVGEGLGGGRLHCHYKNLIFLLGYISDMLQQLKKVKTTSICQ